MKISTFLLCVQLVVSSSSSKTPTEKGKSLKSKESKIKLEEFDYTRYHTYDEVWEWMELMAGSNSNLEKVQIGTTYQGRPILALRTKRDNSNKPGDNSNKPVIFVDALAHAREWISTAASIYAFNKIFNSDSLLKDVDWIFVPMVNVDGYAFTWTKDRNWRKNLRPGVKIGCDGVDLNRNWNVSWGGKFAATDEPCLENYFGPGPLSEPETRHRAVFIRANRDVIKAYVTLHSYAQLIAYPYNFDGEEKPFNYQTQHDIARQMSAAMEKVDGKIYKFGQAADILYKASGVSTDWTQSNGIDINYTIELRDEGEFGFKLPPEQIAPTGDELFAALSVLHDNVKSLYRN